MYVREELYYQCSGTADLCLCFRTCKILFSLGSAQIMSLHFVSRYKPTKAVGGLSSLKARRHRHKDITLAMLAPDIIESDPYVRQLSFKIVFVCIEVLSPSQQFFSLVWAEPMLPGYKPVLWGVNVPYSRTQCGATSGDRTQKL